MHLEPCIFMKWIDLKDAGLKLQDLKTEQTTLEKIFVNLVKENNEI